MLYRIEGANVKIAGTAPTFPLDKPQLPQWLRYVFNESDKWVFETDSEKHDPAAELLPAHQSLSILSFFSQVTELWTRLQIPGRASRHKPWAVYTLLSQHLAGLLEPGVERLMLPEARNRPPPPQFLESPQDRVAAFDAVPLQEQLDRLEDAVTHPAETAARGIALHEAWLAGNVKGMSELLAAQKQAFPESIGGAVEGRNKKWLPELNRIIRENATDQRVPKTLIAVGAAHLCGEQGVLSLLGREGHAVTRLL